MPFLGQAIQVAFERNSGEIRNNKRKLKRNKFVERENKQGGENKGKFESYHHQSMAWQSRELDAARTMSWRCAGGQHHGT